MTSYIFLSSISAYVLFIPINPKMAICVSLDEISDEKQCVEIYEDSITQKIDSEILKQEIKRDSPYLIGKKEELEYLVKNFDKIRNSSQIELSFK